MDPNTYEEEIDEAANNAGSADDKGASQKDAKPQDESKPAAKEPEAAVKDEPKGKLLSDEEYDSFLRMQQERTLNELEADMKKRYPDFRLQKVTDKILEIDEKQPGFANRYMNPVGIENIYLKHFAGKDAQDDEFDIGRGMGNGGVDRAEMMRRINKGEISQSEKYAYLGKFFN